MANKEKYTIADLKILMSTFYDFTRKKAESYVDRSWDDADTEMVLTKDVIKKNSQYYVDTYGDKLELNEDFYNKAMERTEYNLLGAWFNRLIIKHNGIMLHSSAVVVDGFAYLFSADSGTGKSTHTRLWLEYLKEKAFVINDDKPAIRLVDGEWMVYGTPWSGKSNLNQNTSAKLGAIVFLERSDKNWVERIEPKEAVNLFFAQTIRKIEKEENMDIILSRMEKILQDTPVYKMGCNISVDAAKTAYETIRRV